MVRATAAVDTHTEAFLLFLSGLFGPPWVKIFFSHHPGRLSGAWKEGRGPG